MPIAGRVLCLLSIEDDWTSRGQSTAVLSFGYLSLLCCPNVIFIPYIELSREKEKRVSFPGPFTALLSSSCVGVCRLKGIYKGSDKWISREPEIVDSELEEPCPVGAYFITVDR